MLNIKILILSNIKLTGTPVCYVLQSTNKNKYITMDFFLMKTTIAIASFQNDNPTSYIHICP